MIALGFRQVSSCNKQANTIGKKCGKGKPKLPTPPTTANAGHKSNLSNPDNMGTKKGYLKFQVAFLLLIFRESSIVATASLYPTASRSDLRLADLFSVIGIPP